jgi:hypothetical protein
MDSFSLAGLLGSGLGFEMLENIVVELIAKFVKLTVVDGNLSVGGFVDAEFKVLPLGDRERLLELCLLLLGS